MAADEPPYLNVGTDVSAKYKGAFCEAKIKKVNRVVKCKITFKNNLGSLMVQDDQIRGPLRTGALVEVRHPDKNQFLEAVINKMQDYSQYTVVFDDGDETTLRRTSLCLKSGRHFAESPTLDQFPLTNPEHFGTPVMNAVKSKRKRRSTYNSSAVDYSSSDEELIPKKTKSSRRREQEPDVGKVFSVDFGDRRKKDCWYPGLVVLPNTSHDTFKINTKEEYLIRSFRDGKYYQVPKRDTREFSRNVLQMRRVESPALKSAIDKALLYVEKGELPPNWDKALYGSMDMASDDDDDDSPNTDTDTSDDEPSEEKDRFVAQLYKFMDERGTPINKAPTVGNKDINLYKLFKVVHKMGGHNRVTNQNKWKVVYNKMGLQSGNLTGPNQLKVAYKRFLHSFEDFYRKLGCTMVSNSRSTRGRHRSDRNFAITTRNAASPKTRTRSKDKSLETKPEEKSEKKEIRSRFESPKSDEASRKKSERTKPEKEEKDTRTRPKKEDEKEKPRLVRAQSLVKEKTVEEKRDQRTDRARIREESKKEKTTENPEKKETRSSTKLEDQKKTLIKKELKTKKDEKPTREMRNVEKKDDVLPPKDKKTERSFRDKREEKPKIKTEVIKEEETKEVEVVEPRFFKKDKKEIKSPKDDTDAEMKKETLKEETKIVPKEAEPEIAKMQQKIPDSDSQSMDKDDGTDIENTSSENPSIICMEMEDEGPSKRMDEHEQEDTKSMMGLSDADDEGDDTGSEKSEHEGKEGQVDIGDRVKVKYGRGRTRKVYEAKVLKVDAGSGGEKRYYVHYTGWNTRYDEWVKRSFIVENISEKSKISRQRRQELFNKNASLLMKRNDRSPRPPGIASAAKLTRKNSTSSTNSVSSSRTTRSDKNKFPPCPFSKGLQPKKRIRRKSGVSVTALSDSSESDEDGMVFLYRGGDINDEETQMEPDKSASEDIKKESPSEDDEDTKKSQDFTCIQENEDSCTTTTEKSVTSESESKSETIKLESTSEAEMSSGKDKEDITLSKDQTDTKINEKRPSCIYSPKKSYIDPSKKTESAFISSALEKDGKSSNILERKPFGTRTDMPNVLLYKTPDNVVIDMTRSIAAAERSCERVGDIRHAIEDPKVVATTTSISQKSIVEGIKKDTDLETVLVESMKPSTDSTSVPPVTYGPFSDNRELKTPGTEPPVSSMAPSLLSMAPSMKSKPTVAVKPEVRKTSAFNVENLIDKQKPAQLSFTSISSVGLPSLTPASNQSMVHKEPIQKGSIFPSGPFHESKTKISKPKVAETTTVDIGKVSTRPVKEAETLTASEKPAMKVQDSWVGATSSIKPAEVKPAEVKAVVEPLVPVSFASSALRSFVRAEIPSSKPDTVERVLTKSKNVEETASKPSFVPKTSSQEPMVGFGNVDTPEDKNSSTESKESSLQTSVITFVSSSSISSSSSSTEQISKKMVPDNKSEGIKSDICVIQSSHPKSKLDLKESDVTDSSKQDESKSKIEKISSSPDDSAQESLTEVSLDEELSHDEKKDMGSSGSSNDNSVTSQSEDKLAVEALLNESLKSDNNRPTDTTASPEKRDEECDAEKTIEDSSSSNTTIPKKEFKRKKSKIAKKLATSADKDDVVKKGKSRKKKISENEDSKDSETKVKTKKLKRNKKQKRFARQEELEAGGDTEKETTSSSTEKLKKKERRKEKKFTKFQDSKLDLPSTSKGETSKKERKRGRKNKLTDRKTEFGEKKIKKRKKTVVDDNDTDSDKELTSLRFSESKKAKDKKKKAKSKETSSSDDAASSYGKLLIDEIKSFSESQERSDDPDMSFLLCEEKVPASPVIAVLEDTTASSSLDDSNNASPSSEEEPLQDQVNINMYQRSQPPDNLALMNKRTAEARVLANTPPTTPSSSDSIASSSPSHEAYGDYAESTHSGRESGDGNESDSNAGTHRVSESEEYSAAATLAFDVCKSQEKPKGLPLKRQRSVNADDEFSPLKRKRRTKKVPESPVKMPRVRGLSRYSKGESHDMLDSSGTSSNPIGSPLHSSSLFASFSHASSHAMSIASETSSSATRSGRSSLFIPLNEFKDPEKRISILQEKMAELKKVYASLKAEVASIDHRRKKARKKMREAAAGAVAATNNTSSQSDDTQNCS